MNDSEKMICKEFEREAYLYLDNDLQTARKKYWEQHLNDCITCRSLLKDVEAVVNQAHEGLTDDLPDAKFEKMIDHAIHQKKFRIAELLFPQGTAKENYALSFKLAVVGVLAVIAVVISLTIRQPNTAKTISNDLLDWEGTKITSQIEELKNTIKLIHDNVWNKQIMILDQRMKNLEKESDKFSFN